MSTLVLDMVGVANVLRTIIIALFALMAGQCIAILVYYTRVHGHSRGLLPKHIMMLSVTLIVFGLEAVHRNYTRFGEPPNFWLWVNLPLFAATVYGLSLVFRFERRRHRGAPA